jgi:hypothetical protein
MASVASRAGWRIRPPSFGVCDVPKGHARTNPRVKPFENVTLASLVTTNTSRYDPFPQTIVARIFERRMPIYHRPYSPGELQFITTSTCRRAPVFLSPRFCHCFVEPGSADLLFRSAVRPSPRPDLKSRRSWTAGLRYPTSPDASRKSRTRWIACSSAGS